MGKQSAGRGSIRQLMASAAVAIALGAPADGIDGPAYVVKDVTTGTEPGASSDPGPFFDLGHTTVFFASDGIHGRELWRSDGTDAGTVLVKDVAPGPANGVATIGHAADGVLYFPGAAGGLWRSDGTAAGTSRLADLTPWRLIADGNRLYVAVVVDYESVDLFRVDLPSGATTLLGSFPGNQIEPSLTLVGGRLFFAADGGTEGLWTSDGTPEGTRLVRAAQLANSEGGNDNTELIAVGGLVFFVANDAAGWELWRSDGTEAGTYRVRDINPGPRYGIHFNDYWEGAQPFFAALGDVLVFMADDGASGLEPWRSDGTEAGTVRIADVWPGPFGLDGTDGTDDDESEIAQRVIRLVPFDGRLYFTARSGERPLELWVTEGTAETTRVVTAFDDSIGYLGYAVAGPTHLYISGYNQLWISDGTADGTAPVATVDQILHLTSAFGGVIFSGRHERLGFEPWVSDGTAAGTRLLSDIGRGLPGLDPQDLTDFGGTLVFSADDTAHGRELWRSDGSGAGTRLVADIAAGEEGSFPDDLVVSRDTLYFSAGEHDHRALWRSDGTGVGTIRVGGPADPIALGADGRGGVYFVANEPSPGSMWHSDGTAAGTQLIRTGFFDVRPDGPEPAVAIGDVAIFTMPNADTDFEVWRSDGTAAGTTLLAAHEERVSHITRVGDAVLFFTTGSNGDAVLWRTDGTAGGTVEVAGVGDSAAHRHALAVALATVVTEDGLMFFNERTANRYRLWQSDGTPGGTFAVSPATYFSPVQVAAAGSRAFTLTFRPWRAVLGEPGCVDLAETAYDTSTFGSLAALGERLLFNEMLPSGAQRLWSSDGTRTGTAAFQELPASSQPGQLPGPRFVRSGGRAFFAVRQGTLGSELWAVPLSAVPRVASAPCEAPPTPTLIPDHPTPGPFECPNGGQQCTALEIPPATGRAGERVTISVVLHDGNLPIAGTQNDLTLPPGISVVENDDGTPACTVDPSIEKNGSAFAYQPANCSTGENCTQIRALVLSLQDTEPIDDGAVLYRCELLLSNDLEPGDYPLELSELGAAEPTGEPVALEGIDGILTVIDRSGTRPIGEASAGGNGCQTATPDRGAAAVAWLAIGLLAIGLARRQRGR